MARYIITEASIGERFVRFIFKMVADGKKSALKDQIKDDVELQNIIDELDDTHARLKQHLDAHKLDMKQSGYYSGE